MTTLLPIGGQEGLQVDPGEVQHLRGEENKVILHRLDLDYCGVGGDLPAICMSCLFLVPLKRPQLYSFSQAKNRITSNQVLVL